MTFGRLIRDIRAHQDVLVITFSVLVVLYEGLFETLPMNLSLIYLATVFIKYAITGYKKSLELTLSVAIIALFLTPSFLSVVTADGGFLTFLAFTQLFASAFLHGAELFSRRKENSSKLRYPFRTMTWLALLAIMVFGWHLRLDLDSPINAVLFFATFAASLVVFERSIFSLSKTRVWLVILFYWLLILYYSAFFWSGFGRLIISAYFLMPLLIANQHRDIGVRVWHFVLVIPFVLVGFFMMRFGTTDLTRLMEDSWSSHLLLTSEMAETLHTRQAAGLSEYLNQYLLLFLQWVPRDFWPDKPVGVGLSFVDDWIGRKGYGAGHSIALGYIGETMWYLNSWYPLGLILIFLTLLALRALAFSIDRNGYVLFAFLDSFLPSFFWGGMATYGSRVWFFFLPAVATIYLLRIRFSVR